MVQHKVPKYLKLDIFVPHSKQIGQHCSKESMVLFPPVLNIYVWDSASRGMKEIITLLSTSIHKQNKIEF